MKLAQLGDIIVHKRTNRVSTVIGSTRNKITLKFPESTQSVQYDSTVKTLDAIGFNLVASHSDVLIYFKQ